MLGQLLRNESVTTLTREGAELLQRTIDGIVEFAESYPIEFSAYCPADRFDGILPIIGRAQETITAQLLDEGRQNIIVPKDAALAVLDMEECISGAKDRRVTNTRLAFVTSVGGGIVASLVGLSIIKTVAVIAGIGFLVVKPIVEAEDLADTERFSQSLTQRGSAA